MFIEENILVNLVPFYIQTTMQELLSYLWINMIGYNCSSSSSKTRIMMNNQSSYIFIVIREKLRTVSNAY